jgi:hypothetical protein
MVNQALYKTSYTLEERYQLHFIARIVTLYEGLYKAVGMQFRAYRPLTKEEGRKLLLVAGQELLNQLNGHPALQPFFEIAPFTMDNIEFVIFAVSETGEQLYDPDISVFALRDGVITYTKHDSQKKYHEVTEEFEAYSDAVKMNKEQSSDGSAKSELESPSVGHEVEENQKAALKGRVYQSEPAVNQSQKHLRRSKRPR